MPNRPEQKKVLRLVPPPVNQATIDKLQELLGEALSAELVGVAFIAIYREGYSVDAIGEADTRAPLTRGLVQVLEDLLRDRMRRSRR